MNKRSLGVFYEQAVVEFLKDKGITIIQTNYFCKLGEIDIIGIDGNTLVFFEVKYRKDDKYGNAIEAVNIHKQQKIRNVATYYTAFKKWQGFYRYDVVGITGNKIDWIKNAF